jgi:hypothetical protein
MWHYLGIFLEGRKKTTKIVVNTAIFQIEFRTRVPTNKKHMANKDLFTTYGEHEVIS